jgi:hypothetical protein
MPKPISSGVDFRFLANFFTDSTHIPGYLFPLFGQSFCRRFFPLFLSTFQQGKYFLFVQQNPRRNKITTERCVKREGMGKGNAISVCAHPSEAPFTVPLHFPGRKTHGQSRGKQKNSVPGKDWLLPLFVGLVIPSAFA